MLENADFDRWIRELKKLVSNRGYQFSNFYHDWYTDWEKGLTPLEALEGVLKEKCLDVNSNQ